MLSEEFEVGQIFKTMGWTLSEGELITYAALYDPLGIHMDQSHADVGPYGHIIASGFQTLAIARSLWVRMGHLLTTSEGGLGLDELKWLLPVYAGDTLRAEVEIESKRLTRKGKGLVVFFHRVLNQRNEVVMTYKNINLVARRAGRAG